MKRIIIFMLAAFLLPFGTQAQLSKLMGKYQEQPCATVTQLDKSLYGLYKKQNLSPEAEQMLQKLEEVNILTLNLATCGEGLQAEVSKQLHDLLDAPDQYRLVKSHTDQAGKQQIYAKNQKGKVVSLVIWNQTSGWLDIVELRGDIQLENVAQLSKALNVNGLNTLSALSPNNKGYVQFKRKEQEQEKLNDNLEQISKEMQKMAKEIRKEVGEVDFDVMEEMFGSFEESFSKVEEMFGSFEESFSKAEEMFQQYEDVMSNSVQISTENGKTKIKIDSKNSDMTYVIDGKSFGKDSVKMPDNIRKVNIRPSKNDFKKSYLMIQSGNKIGNFTNYKNSVLTFRYENQDYSFNLKKSNTPLLVVNGELYDDFDIEPSSILQIRPQSKIEKEVGNYPSAEIIINTK